MFSRTYEARRGRAAAALSSILSAALIGATAAPVAAAEPAPAQRVCGDRAVILSRLEQRHEETREGLGLASDGGVLELLVSPEGSWTLLVTYPDRPTCVVAVGQAWQAAGPGGQKI